MGERLEWVQIIEPKSKDIMYANLVTGECVWEAPPGARIKRTDENQWWELFDASTKRNYYYNAKSQRTVWQRPPGADIIPLAKLQMIKENTEPKDEQLTSTIITSPASTINQTVQQRTNNNKWKQISLQGLDLSSHQNKLTSPTKMSTPPLNSAAQRSIRRTATILHPNTTLTSSISSDPRRTVVCNDITLPSKANQTNSFFRRRTQQQTFNGQLDKSSSTSSSTKSSLIDENSTKTSSATFSLLRQHSSPTKHSHKIEKSTYDNLTNATINNENTVVSSTHFERKSSYPLNKKANRHLTNDSLTSDAYDNFPDKNGYDNYPIIRKTTASSTMTTSQNDADERQLSSSTLSTPRNEFNTKRSQSINLKTPLTLKSTSTAVTPDENKRSGSAHHRTTKSSTTTAATLTKDQLSNLHVASCIPLNEHLFNQNSQTRQQSPILRHISSPSLQSSTVLSHQQAVHNNNHNNNNNNNNNNHHHHPTANNSMESSTIMPSDGTFNRLSYGRNRVRKKQPRTNPNYVNIEIKSNDGSLRSTYIRIHDGQKPKTSTLSSSSSSSSSSSTKNPSIEQESISSNSHFHSQPYLNDVQEYFTSNDTNHHSIERTKISPQWLKNNEERNEMILQQYEQTDNSQADDAQTLTNKTALMMKQFVACNDEFLFHSTTDPININFNHENSNNDRSVVTGCGTNSNTSTLSSPTLPIYYDGNSNSPPLSNSMTPHSMNRSHEPDSSTSSLNRPVSIHLHNFNDNGNQNNQTSIYKQWTSSSPTKAPAAIVEVESDILFNDMLNFNTHKRGLFGKRLTQDDLLSWSKEPITKPLLRTMDKVLKKEAPEIFKLIQTYMGDKKSKQIASLNTCLELTTKGWSLPTIRDELYLQLIKQTSYNINAESLQRGWELMAVCLSFFPPSSKFQSLLEKYISLQTNGESDTPEVPISIYANVCLKRLEKILQTGPKKGLKKPTFEEIELSKHTIHFPSMFGATLEEVMAMQRTRFPERRLPWIQTILSEEVLRLNGAQIEGIFRVPGDLDGVNALKVKCDQWQLPSLEDAHLPASLLKLWYRELAEPLIPSIFYEQCILNCDIPDTCIRIVNSLPDINRAVLTYLIRFLQVFGAAENVVITKMDVNNLSMVFAPNILRCDSEDAKVIFENARKEMLFIKILILNLDTNSIEGVI
ncbi:unnamed protein product [Rotaria socialis]|uniref:Rho GTPase-activating protein 39 n=1 Tax=Rotaria socialis TaxID=392032 RepID=A0A818SYY3_9BILA|nr:unnamed protein product [Rotaria socialis]